MTDAPKRIWVGKDLDQWCHDPMGIKADDTEYHYADLSAKLVRAGYLAAIENLRSKGHWASYDLLRTLSPDPEAIAAIVAQVRQGK